MKTYDYLDRVLYDMQDKVDNLNVKYASQMYEYLEKSFEEINQELQKNRDELKDMAVRTKNGEDWLYESRDENKVKPEEEGGDK